MSDILVVFGEGGHSSQMHRLVSHLTFNNFKVISLVDKIGISKSFANTRPINWFSKSVYRNLNPCFVPQSFIETITR